MDDNSQVNPAGDQGVAVNQDTLGWRSALPDEFKEHEFVKTFTKPGDFVKSALEIKTEHEALKTKMDGAIFKPGDDATAEQREAYFRSIGKPEKPTEYEFPKGEGIEHDPKMVEWAQATFHQANLSKEQAGVIGQAWDGFMAQMVKADADAKAKAESDAATAIKQELGEEYPVAMELTRRMLKETATPEELQYLADSGMGNNPALIRLVFKLAKKTGEDTSPAGNLPKGSSPSIGMNYTSMEQFKGG